MRILMLTEASSAGVGRHVMDLTQGLTEAGHTVELAYARARVDARFDRQLAEWGSPAVTVVPMRRSPHWQDLGAARAVRRILRERGPFDVVHAHSTKAGLITRMLPRRLAGCWVFTPHCPFSMKPGLPWAARAAVRTLERAIVGRADRVIAVSADEADHLAGLGRTDRIHVVLNGLALATTTADAAAADRAKARRAAEIPPDGPLVGFVGRLSDQKDPGMLLDAMEHVARAVPAARLALAGWGPLEEELRARAASMAIGERVHWLGYVEGESVLPAFDVFAMPSRYEGMPYVLLEALAAGLPIVSTDVGGARHAIEHGHNGFISPVGDATAFGRHLVELLGDPAVRTRMADAAAAKAPQFSVQRMVDDTVAVYQGGPSGRSPTREETPQPRADETRPPTSQARTPASQKARAHG